MKKSKLEIPSVELKKIYYGSRSHSAASILLSKKFGTTPRNWRYRLRKMEAKGMLMPEILKLHKSRDLLGIKTMRRKEPKRERIENNIMLTVHFKIDYKKIGARGFHPIYLEGFYSKIVMRDFGQSEINAIMNEVQSRLASEFGDLTSYLEINKQGLEEGFEVEELSKTRKRDNEFEYDYKRG